MNEMGFMILGQFVRKVSKKTRQLFYLQGAPDNGSSIGESEIRGDTNMLKWVTFLILLALSK